MIQHLKRWCDDNNLHLNTAETKDMIIHFSRTKDLSTPPSTLMEEVERVESFKFLGVHISADLTWSTNISHQVGKAQQRLHFLRKLRQVQLPQSSTMKSLLTSCCTLCFNCCTVEDKRKLQRVVRAAERPIGTSLTPRRQTDSTEAFTHRLPALQPDWRITLHQHSWTSHLIYTSYLYLHYNATNICTVFVTEAPPPTHRGRIIQSKVSSNR